MCLESANSGDTQADDGFLCAPQTGALAVPAAAASVREKLDTIDGRGQAGGGQADDTLKKQLDSLLLP